LHSYICPVASAQSAEVVHDFVHIFVMYPQVNPPAVQTVLSAEQSPQSPAATTAQTQVPEGQVPPWGAQTVVQSASAVQVAATQVEVPGSQT